MAQCFFHPDVLIGDATLEILARLDNGFISLPVENPVVHPMLTQQLPLKFLHPGGAPIPPPPSEWFSLLTFPVTPTDDVMLRVDRNDMEARISAVLNQKMAFVRNVTALATTCKAWRTWVNTARSLWMAIFKDIMSFAGVYHGFPANTAIFNEYTNLPHVDLLHGNTKYSHHINAETGLFDPRIVSTSYLRASTMHLLFPPSAIQHEIEGFVNLRDHLTQQSMISSRLYAHSIYPSNTAVMALNADFKPHSVLINNPILTYDEEQALFGDAHGPINPDARYVLVRCVGITNIINAPTPTANRRGWLSSVIAAQKTRARNRRTIADARKRLRELLLLRHEMPQGPTPNQIAAALQTGEAVIIDGKKYRVRLEADDTLVADAPPNKKRRLNQ